MIIKNSYKPTMIKSNDRYRGPSEKEKYQNYVLEAVHDINFLGSVLDTNELDENQKGHSDYIEANHYSYNEGYSFMLSDIESATSLYKVKEKINRDMNILSNDWTTFGETEIEKTDNGFLLSVSSSSSPSGIRTLLEVEAGDIIYIRLKVKSISGDNESFALGSSNVNKLKSDVEKRKISKTSSGIYVDKWLYCEHQETISLDVFTRYSPIELVPSSFEISELNISYLYEEKMGLMPIDSVGKEKINKLNSHIKNMEVQ